MDININLHTLTNKQLVELHEELIHTAQSRLRNYTDTKFESTWINTTNLCAYDPRNPYNIRSDDTIPYEQYAKENPVCSCDNCFYGRTKLAQMVLQLQDQYDDLSLTHERFVNKYAP